MCEFSLNIFENFGKKLIFTVELEFQAFSTFQLICALRKVSRIVRIFQAVPARFQNIWVFRSGTKYVELC